MDPAARPAAELEPVDCPFEVMYLWEYFLDMNKRRTNNGFSKNPVSEVEMQAWQKRHGIRLEFFEYMALDALEDVYTKSQNKKGK